MILIGIARVQLVLWPTYPYFRLLPGDFPSPVGRIWYKTPKIKDTS